MQLESDNATYGNGSVIPGNLTALYGNSSMGNNSDANITVPFTRVRYYDNVDGINVLGEAYILLFDWWPSDSPGLAINKVLFLFNRNYKM